MYFMYMFSSCMYNVNILPLLQSRVAASGTTFKKMLYTKFCLAVFRVTAGNIFWGLEPQKYAILELGSYNNLHNLANAQLFSFKNHSTLLQRLGGLSYGWRAHPGSRPIQRQGDLFSPGGGRPQLRGLAIFLSKGGPHLRYLTMLLFSQGVAGLISGAYQCSFSKGGLISGA